MQLCHYAIAGSIIKMTLSWRYSPQQSTIRCNYAISSILNYSLRLFWFIYFATCIDILLYLDARKIDVPKKSHSDL
jgi:hypothetical protein